MVYVAAVLASEAEVWIREALTDSASCELIEIRWVSLAEAGELMGDLSEMVHRYIGERSRARPSAVRSLAGVGGPAPPFLNPPRDGRRVSPGLAAQVRGLPGERLVQLPFRGALEDPGHLGQQVGPAARDGAELGHGDGFLVSGERAPLRVMPRLAGKLGHDHPVSVGSGTILVHLDRIEHRYDKSKLASAMKLTVTWQKPGMSAVGVTVAPWISS
jgi:hypothetical protein